MEFWSGFRLAEIRLRLGFRLDEVRLREVNWLVSAHGLLWGKVVTRAATPSTYNLMHQEHCRSVCQEHCRLVCQ